MTHKELKDLRMKNSERLAESLRSLFDNGDVEEKAPHGYGAVDGGVEFGFRLNEHYVAIVWTLHNPGTVGSSTSKDLIGVLTRDHASSLGEYFIKCRNERREAERIQAQLEEDLAQEQETSKLLDELLGEP